MTMTPSFDTRQAAFDAMHPRKGDLRARCLRALTYSRPRSADDIARYLGESILAIRPRITELKQSGLIEPAGSRSINASGRSAVEWRLVE